MPVLVTLALGLRRSELLGLRWGDIDFKKGTVNITRSIIRDRDSTIRIDDLKNISSHRVILMPEFLIGALVSIGPPEAKNDEYLFGCPDGSPMNPDTFSSAYCSFRNAHGLPRVRFHDLRHSHASFLFNSGVEPRIIQDRLGHSNINTTLDIYVHTDYKKQRGAADHINDLFSSSLNVTPIQQNPSERG